MKPEKELLLKRVFESKGYECSFDSNKKDEWDLVNKLVTEGYLVKSNRQPFGNSDYYTLTRQGVDFALGGFTEGIEKRKAIEERQRKQKIRWDVAKWVLGTIISLCGLLSAYLLRCHIGLGK